MNTPPRHPPRFLPTLTEVVRASDLSEEIRPSQPDSDALTQTLLVQLQALVETRVQEEIEKLIRSVVAERADAFVAGLKMELHQEVRKMVSDAVGIRNESNKFNS